MISAKLGIGADRWRIKQEAIVNGTDCPGKPHRGPRVKELLTFHSRCRPIAGCPRSYGPVGDKERHHHHVSRVGQFPPIRNQRRFFHVNIEHCRITSERRIFSASCLAATALFSFRSVPCATMSRLVSASDRPGATSRARCRSKSVIAGMIPDRLAIFPDLAACSRCFRPAQFQLARNNRLREISFADEIGHDVNLRIMSRIEQKGHRAGWALLSKTRTPTSAKNSPAPNVARHAPGRRARIRVHGRAVADDERALWPLRSHRQENVQRSTSTSNAQFKVILSDLSVGC